MAFGEINIILYNEKKKRKEKEMDKEKGAWICYFTAITPLLHVFVFSSLI